MNGNKIVYNKISYIIQYSIIVALSISTNIQAKSKKTKIEYIRVDKALPVEGLYKTISTPTTAAPSSTLPMMAPPSPLPPPQPAGLVEPSDYLLQVKVSTDSKIMFVAGYLGTGAYMKINRIFNANPDVKTLYLESQGGIVFEGLLINNLIKAKKINTYVESICASACTMAFVAGEDRAASPAARIGFHRSYKIQPYTAANIARETSPVGNAVLRDSYVQAGLELEFINKIMTTPSETMWYPTAIELQAAHVVTRKSKGKELVLPANMGRQRNEIETAMLAQPLWQTAAKQNPILYNQVVDDARLQVAQGTFIPQAINNAQYTLTAKLFTRISEYTDDILDDYAILFSTKINTDMKINSGFCYSSITRPWANVAPLTAELTKKEHALLIKMLETPTGKPLQSTDEAAVIATNFAADLILRGVVNQYDLMRQNCVSTQKIFQEVASLPKIERAKMIRAILGGSAFF
jgi:Clp protease